MSLERTSAIPFRVSQDVVTSMMGSGTGTEGFCGECSTSREWVGVDSTSGEEMLCTSPEDAACLLSNSEREMEPRASLGVK